MTSNVNWKVVQTGDILDLINGYAFKSKEFLDAGAPVLKIKNVKAGSLTLSNLAYVDEEFLRTKPDKAVQKHDLLISMSGNRHDGSMETWVGKVCWFGLDTPYLVNQRVGILRLKSAVDANPRFLAYQLSSESFQRHFIAVATSSGGQANLSPAQIKSTELLLPPRRVQDWIVSVAGRLEDKIQLNHQINQTLEQMAQAIFKSWFVDFEPVKAKVAARKRWHALQPGNEPASPVCYGGEPDGQPIDVDLDTYMNLAAMQAISGKDADQLAQMQAEQPEQYAELRATAELFPSAMQDSELGEIPEGWSVSQIGDEVTVVGGGTPATKAPEYWEGGHIHWTTPKDLSNLADKVLIDTERKITPAGLAKISSGLLPVDTVLMSSRAPVGYLALAKTPVAVNQGYIAMKCERQLTPEFVIQWCTANMEEIKGRASGTTFAEINKKNFRAIRLVLPSVEAINAFSQYVRPIYAQVETKVRESRTLSNLRDTLLPKLLSGELTLPDTEEPQTELQDVAHV